MNKTVLRTLLGILYALSCVAYQGGGGGGGGGGGVYEPALRSVTWGWVGR